MVLGKRSVFQGVVYFQIKNGFSSDAAKVQASVWIAILLEYCV